jgi:hypothetical protein
VKKYLMAVLAALAFAGSSGAFAQSAAPNNAGGLICGIIQLFGGNCPPVLQPKPKAVPEINARSSAPAIALLFGVLLIGAESLRRRS